MSEHILLICITAFNYCDAITPGIDRFLCADYASQVCEEADEVIKVVKLNDTIQSNK